MEKKERNFSLAKMFLPEQEDLDREDRYRH